MATPEHRAALADRLVRSLYAGFDTRTLQTMAQIGREDQTWKGDLEVKQIFQAALEREIERRLTPET
jgi:hypothetical protein